MPPIRAYAKINIGLKILSKRPDGYHNIETIFHRINLYDEMEVFENNKIILETNLADLPTDENNICIRAFKFFKETFNIKSGIKIILQKNIPLGAGLGGGSSDAATLLKTLPEVFNLKLDQNQLFNIAKQLGADVPYFLGNGTAYATGIGDHLEYFELPIPYWIITITPRINISTKWAYENLTVKNYITGSNISSDQLKKNIANKIFLKTNIINDFEELVFRHFPLIQSIKENLYFLGADFALLSGSGATVFAFVSDVSVVKNIYNKYKDQYKVSITEPLFIAEQKQQR